MEVIKFRGGSLVDASAVTQVADALEAQINGPKFVGISDQMGMPHAGFIAATNINDALAAILQGERPSPRALRWPRPIPKVWGGGGTRHRPCARPA